MVVFTIYYFIIITIYYSIWNFIFSRRKNIILNFVFNSSSKFIGSSEKIEFSYSFTLYINSTPPQPIIVVLLFNFIINITFILYIF